MMYSDEDIKRVIASGELIVDPYLPEMIRPAGLTLHLGEILLKPESGTVIDIKKNVTPKYDEIIITDENPYLLKHGEFLLGATFEKVTVGGKLGFFIEGRSTLARVGLTIVQTAMLVYPGHTNRAITLEFANHGPNPILLYPKMKIARAAIFELKTKSMVNYDATGKYRDQGNVGPPIFENEFGHKKLK